MGCFWQAAYPVCMPLFCFHPESRAPGSALAYPDGGVNSGAALGYYSWMHVYLSCSSPPSLSYLKV